MGIKLRNPVRLFALLLLIVFFSCESSLRSTKTLSLDKWTYIQVDAKRTRYDGRLSGDGFWFGLAMGDLTGDGYKDIVSGKWFYRNPGADMEAKWQRVAFDDSMDALLIVDIDDDERGDVIAAKCNQQFWYEANDRQGNSWTCTQIGDLPVCNHGTTTQGYHLAQIVPDGKPEVLLHGKGIYYMQIPENPGEAYWPAVTILEAGSNGEWLSPADIDRDGDLDLCVGVYPGGEHSEKNAVAWVENTGDGSENWEMHEVGMSQFHIDKVLPADFNGDGRLDLAVSEERWPGLEPDASMYWFEAPANPKSPDWKKHLIVTQYSMNNLDVADVDGDGNVDIVTCEHKGPKEKLQIWENNGKGNFTERLIDEGKESHLGARLADMDGDGDLDIVSIAWNDYQYLHLWRNDAILGESSGKVKSIPLGLDLKGDMKYRLPIEVKSGEYERYDKPVQIELNFTQLLNKLSSNKAFDNSSIRVVEVNSSGKIIDESVVFQFDKADNYDPETNAAGTLVFMIKGTTPEDETRYFHILFGEAGGYYIQPVFPKQVQFDDYIRHEGYQSFKVETRNATYYYHKKGSGFASMEDIEGNDWIGFHPTIERKDGPKGAYRGIPNIAPAGFHPGAGENNSVSKILAQGPIKLKIQSETTDGKWGCIWEIYPYYAMMTLFKKGEAPYWILYEGTPGGEFNLTDYGINSAGEKFALPEYTIDNKWNGNLPEPEWVYFGDANLNRVLYLIHHEYSDVIDEYWHFGEAGMTVFGFGRGPREEGWQRLTAVPTHLTIGFAQDNDFAVVSKVINSAFQELDISVGNPETIEEQ